MNRSYSKYEYSECVVQPPVFCIFLYYMFSISLHCIIITLIEGGQEEVPGLNRDKNESNSFCTNKRDCYGMSSKHFLTHLPLCQRFKGHYQSHVLHSPHSHMVNTSSLIQSRNSTQNSFRFFPLNMVGHYLNVDTGAYPNKVLHSPGNKRIKPGNRTHSFSESTTSAQRLNKAVESGPIFQSLF